MWLQGIAEGVQQRPRLRPHMWGFSGGHLCGFV